MSDGNPYVRQIEHVKNEKRPGNGIYWIGAGFLLFCWGGYLYFRSPDVWSLCLGGSTGFAITVWAIEKFGSTKS